MSSPFKQTYKDAYGNPFTVKNTPLTHTACFGCPAPQSTPKPVVSPYQGLNEDVRVRVIENARTLLRFYRDFIKLCTPSDQWALLAYKRYFHFILLQGEYPNQTLIPTADILFVHISHAIRTNSYHKYLQKNIIPNNLLAPQTDFETKVKITARLWKTKYKCSYYDSKEWSEILRPPYIACLGEDIPQNFVSPSFSSSIGITTNDIELDLEWVFELERQLKLVKSYFKLDEENTIVKLSYYYDRFLSLVKKSHSNGNTSSSPPIFIDLIWHAHQCSPKLYESECNTLLGFSFPHEPRPEGLKEKEKSFQEAWVNEFKEDFSFLLPSVPSSTPVQESVNIPTHNGITCDECRMNPLRGIRYKCSCCPDYDLCAICFSGTTHPKNHCFIVIKEPSVKQYSTPLLTTSTFY